ncbi:MAG: VCBS domain-containing protein, partial [Pseudomonadota bacterium]
EDGQLTESGSLTITDVDTGEDMVQAQTNAAGIYGTFSVDAAGSWNYVLDNASTAVQALDAGETVMDMFDVTSADGGTVETVVITISGTNDAPVIAVAASSGVTILLAGTAFAVAEGFTGPVLDADASDIDGETDAGGGLVYSLGGADAALFAIDAGTGAVSFITAPDAELPADAGGNNVYEIDIIVTDGAGATDTQSVQIAVTNTNEAPVLAAGAGITIAENDPSLSVDFTATDPEGETEGAGLSYSLGGADASFFLINTATGELTSAAAFDFEALADADGDNVYDLEITATDSGLASVTEAFTVTVTDVNEDPDLVVDSPITTENIAVMGQLTATDPDGDTVTFAVDTGPNDGTLSVFNTNTGAYTYTPDLGFTGTDTFTVTASDGNGGTDTETVTVTVDPGGAGSFITADFSAETKAIVVDLGAETKTDAARVLLLGDSISEGFSIEGAYRPYLWEDLVIDNGLWVDFVGEFDNSDFFRSGKAAGPSFIYDDDHQAAPDIDTAEVLAGQGVMFGTATNPLSTVLTNVIDIDISLVALGTNDGLNAGLLNSTELDAIEANLDTILSDIHTANTGSDVFLGIIPDVFASGGVDADEIASVNAIQARIPDVAATANTAGIDTTLVDFSGLSVGDFQGDGIHPTAATHATIGGLWSSALLAGTTQTGGTLNGTTEALVAGVQQVEGSAFGDRLTGDAAVNLLNGNGGDDWLEGLGGDDNLTGGTGADVFVFSTNDGADTITDYAAEDAIYLRGGAAVTETLTQVGADVEISFDLTTITVENVTIADIAIFDI